MQLLTRHLLELSIVGAAICLFALGQFRRPPKWKWLLTGALVLMVAGIGAVVALKAPPAVEPTVDIPLPPVPIAPTSPHIERLKMPWGAYGPADWPVAETLALCSKLAYLPPVDAEIEFTSLGFKNVTPIVAGSMIGYVLSVEDVMVIAFRGTDTEEVSDWLANLSRSEFQTEEGPMHKGFRNAYYSLKPQIQTIIGSLGPPKHLWVTGHSLGGALALVCSYDLCEIERFSLDGVITFGQPRVARGNLVKHLDTLLANRYVHFVNNDDMVPRIPPSFDHCGELVWFSGNQLKRSKPKQLVAGAAPPPPAEASPPPQETELIPTIEDKAPSELLPPVSEAEFKRMQAEAQAKEKAEEQIDLMPVGPVAYGAGPSSLVDDHSMGKYVERIRTMLGVPSTP